MTQIAPNMQSLPSADNDVKNAPKINDVVSQQNNAAHEFIEKAQQEAYSIKNDPDIINTVFKFDNAHVELIHEIPFYARVSRYIRKIMTTKIDTAGVMIDPHTDELILMWNPKFVKGLTKAEITGLLIHEFSHIIFLHLTLRHRKHSDWNLALDLAINSIIQEMKHGDDKKISLPQEAWVPGEPYKLSAESAKKMTPDQLQKHQHIADLVARMPKLMASEQYFMLLQADRAKNPDKWPSDEEYVVVMGNGIDDHSHWSDMPDLRERISEKVAEIVAKARQDAEQESSGWGNIPQSVIDQIRAYTSRAIDWRTLLKHFIGTLIRAGHRSSYKRINKKYPWIHPGRAQNYAAKLLIAADQSGSVSNEMLALFFNELDNYTKKCEFDYLPFDCEAREDEIERYRKGKKFKFERVRGGGTDFNAPTEVFNAPQNRGKWDGLLIMTDGQAPEPDQCHGTRAWILGPGCKMYFDTTETVIVTDNNTKQPGAWY